jgi:hypothetical protein
MLLSCIACIGGCGQVLGLGDYSEAPAGGAGDATALVEGAADGTVADGANEASSDAAADASSDVASEVNPDAGFAADGAGVEAATDAPSDGAPQADSAGAGDGAADAPSQGACVGAMACAPVPPFGWTGPLALWEGSGNAPPCGAGFNAFFAGGADASAAPAQCACGCASPSGFGCGPMALFFSAGDCATACGPDGGIAAVAQGACLDISAFNNACGQTTVTMVGSQASGGSCAPDGSASVPAWTWGNKAVACSPSAQSFVGCPAGNLCIPATQSPFETGFCIMRSGLVACPPGAYSVHRAYYGGATDTRGCSDCTCAVGGIDCNANAQVQAWKRSTCSGGSGILSPGCNPTGGMASGVQFATSPSGNGSCTPDGGRAIGGVTPQGVQTICCTQ